VIACLGAGCSGASGGSARASAGGTPSAGSTNHSSSGAPGGLLGIASEAGVVAGCADIHTATTYQQAGDDASVRDALRAAITSFRKLPVNPDAATAATAIEGRLASADIAGALRAGSTFCAAHGQ
jgi:hypothetical protein